MKIREFLNKANRLVTYTLEQLEEMTNETLDRKARLFINEDFIFSPCTEGNDSYILQERALLVDGIKYTRHLIYVTSGKKFDRRTVVFVEDIPLLLRATPRQRTIAAILTLQG